MNEPDVTEQPAAPTPVAWLGCVILFAIYSIIYEAIIWGIFGYAVFVKDRSGWWVLVAIMCSGAQLKPKHFGMTGRQVPGSATGRERIKMTETRKCSRCGTDFGVVVHPLARWSVKPLFAWYDCWVGIFWDSRKRKLYILPLPCVGLVFEFPMRHNKVSATPVR